MLGCRSQRKISYNTAGDMVQWEKNIVKMAQDAKTRFLNLLLLITVKMQNCQSFNFGQDTFFQFKLVKL